VKSITVLSTHRWKNEFNKDRRFCRRLMAGIDRAPTILRLETATSGCAAAESGFSKIRGFQTISSRLTAYYISVGRKLDGAGKREGFRNKIEVFVVRRFAKVSQRGVGSLPSANSERPGAAFAAAYFAATEAVGKRPEPFDFPKPPNQKG
jgi:hypothetical protein